MVTKFVNNIMLQGKKNAAFDIFYEAIELVTQRSKEDGLEVWKKALANVTPSVEVRSRRIGGATFQIPSEIRPGRKQSIGMKNMVKYARKRHEKSMQENWPAKSWQLIKKKVPLSRKKKIRTVWPKLTRLSPISGSNKLIKRNGIVQNVRQVNTYQEHRHYGAHRRG